MKFSMNNIADVLSAGCIPIKGPRFRAEFQTPHHVQRRKFLVDLLPKNGVGAELGVFTGLFSVALLKGTKPCEAYFVDPWWQAFGENYPDWGNYTDYGRLTTREACSAASHRISKHSGTCQTKIVVEYSVPFLRSMPDYYFDWIYLDSTHQYRGTVEELAVIRKKLKPDGILAGDDWHDDESHRHHGVAKAVIEAVDRGEYKDLRRHPHMQFSVMAA